MNDDKVMKIRLQGGPFGSLGGLDVDAKLMGSDYFKYGGWRWSWAGKKTEGGRRIFCKVPTERKLWRMILALIGATGKDPRLQERIPPTRYTPEEAAARGKQGQGARRRRAAHA